MCPENRVQYIAVAPFSMATTSSNVPFSMTIHKRLNEWKVGVMLVTCKKKPGSRLQRKMGGRVE